MSLIDAIRNRFLIHLISIALMAMLTSCSAVGLRSAQSCVPIKIKSPRGGISFQLADRFYYGGETIEMDKVYCGDLPTVITFYPDIAVAKYSTPLNPPMGFMKNPSRQLYITAKEDLTRLVFYRMQLSDITTKYLAGPETEEERAQRLKNEKLWRAISNKNLEQVKAAIAEGASLERNWKDPFKFDQWDVYGQVYASKDPEILDYLIMHGLKIYPRPADSILRKNIRYDQNADVMAVFLKHGFDPNSLYKEYSEYGEGFSKDPVLYLERLIYLAATQTNPDFVKVLLEYGAEIDFITHDGEPFMQWAEKHATPEVWQLLVEHQGKQ